MDCLAPCIERNIALYLPLHKTTPLTFVFFLFCLFPSSSIRVLYSKDSPLHICFRLWLNAYIFFCNPFPSTPRFFPFFFFFFLFIRGSGLSRLWLGFNFSWLLEARLLAVGSKKGMTTCVRCHAEPEARFLVLSLTDLYLSFPLFDFSPFFTKCIAILSSLYPTTFAALQ